MRNDIGDLLRVKHNKKRKRAVSTGSTLLNLACTENPYEGFHVGGYYYFVGDSRSGKTWLTLTCFAEAVSNPAFKDHHLIFDDVEGGALMDIAHCFGKQTARRIESPATVKGKRVNSTTVESFYYHIWDWIEKGDPFIYVLDSQDALDSLHSRKKFAQQRKAAEDNQDVAGSYGDGKAKIHSENIRSVCMGLRDTNSILVLVGQTRDNLGFGFEKKTRSGGKALRFYANLEIWTSVKGEIKKTVRGKKRSVGTLCIAEVRKNRVTGKTGKDRSVVIPIYHGFGIDDVGSCVDFLIEEKHWKRVKQKASDEEGGRNSKPCYDASELLLKGTRNRIIAQIEEECLEDRVRKVVAGVWRQLEAECEPKRKRRYI